MKIKKILLTLGLLGIGLVNITFADNYTTNGYYYDGVIGNQYNYMNKTYSISHNGNFFTNGENLLYWIANNYGGQFKYSYSWLNGNLYFIFANIDNSIGGQYIANKRCIAPVSTRNYNGTLHENCIYNNSIDDIKLLAGDFTGYVLGIAGSSTPDRAYNDELYFMLCLSDGINDYCVECGQYGGSSCTTGLNLNIANGDFTTLASYDWTFAPFGNGGQNTGNNEENIETITGGQRLCPPIKNDITMYGRNYTTSLCWSDGTTNSGGEIINTGYVSILTAYPTYQEYLNGYNTYKTYCNQESPRYDYTECKNQLQALPYGKAGATIVRNGIKSGLPTNKIYQYCYLQLNFTENEKRDKSRCNTTEDEYFAPGITGDLRQESGGNPVEGLSDMIEYSDEGFISPNDGTIFDDILPDGILSRKSITNINFIGNITKLIAKILVLFKTRPIVDGILPPVILSLLLLIILFKMYKK